jgi:hypothetical protein
MKRFLKIAGIATLVAVLAVGAVSAVALAQEGSEDSSGWNFRERLHQAIAGILGISVEEYETAIDTAQGQVLDEAVADGWLTQEQAEKMQERMNQAPGPHPMGRGFPGGHGAWGGRGNPLISVAADELGMELSDLMAELQEGKSIAEVAEEQGVDPQTIADAHLAQVAETLADAVENERITQEQADSTLEHITETVDDQLESACGGFRPGGFMGRGGRGFRFPGGKGCPGCGESLDEA